MVSPHVRNPMRSLAGVLIVSLLAPLVPAGAQAAIPAYNPLASATKIAVTKETLTPFKDTDFDKPKLSPIVHKDFDVVDPSTKQKVDPNTTVTAPSGAKVKAGDYAKHLNDLETDLNSRGQSLRNGTSFDLGTLHGGHQSDLTPTISRSPQIKGQYNLTKGPDRLHQDVNPDALPKAVSKPDDDDSAIAAEVAALNAQVNAMEKQKAIQALPYGYKSQNLKPIAPPPAPAEPPQISKTNTYTESSGNKSLAAIALNASATSEVGKGHVGHALTSAGATVYFFGHSLSLFNGTGDATPKQASFTFSIVGDSFASNSAQLTNTTSTVTQGSKSVSFFDFSIPISVSIFTVTLAASAGASFSVKGIAGGYGPQYPYPGVATAILVQSAEADADFSASAGIGDTSGSFGFGLAGGINGELTIASFTLPVSANADVKLIMRRTGKLKTDKNIYGCYLVLDYGNFAQLNYTFLSGSVSFFIKGCFIFCATVLNVHVFSWDGITGNDTLFTQQGQNVPVSPKYSDLADYGTPDPGSTYSKDGSSGMPQACEQYRADQQQYGNGAS